MANARTSHNHLRNHLQNVGLVTGNAVIAVWQKEPLNTLLWSRLQIFEASQPGSFEY